MDRILQGIRTQPIEIHTSQLFTTSFKIENDFSEEEIDKETENALISLIKKNGFSYFKDKLLSFRTCDLITNKENSRLVSIATFNTAYPGVNIENLIDQSLIGGTVFHEQ